jgi:hypothetical protein
MKYIAAIINFPFLSLCYSQEIPDMPPAQGDYAIIKISPKVTDENGAPIKDAEVHVAVGNPLEYKDGYNDFLGRSDEQGFFVVESKIQTNTTIEVKKLGYYSSRLIYISPQNQVLHNLKSGDKIQPWNPTVPIILKKIGKPIPMIVRLASGGSRSRFKPTAEQLGKEIGWDLIEGDWVVPDGNGKMADFIVRFESNYKNKSNSYSSVTIRCANPNDGLIIISELKGELSLLKHPRTAPLDGYELRELKYSRTVDDGILTVSPEQKPKGYFVRLRTTKDETGQVISAIYAKITRPFELEDITFQGRNRLFVNFDYYLNPSPNDRNLEYDQKNNLAPEADKDLRWPP